MDYNQLIDKIEKFVNKDDISLKNTQEIEVLLENLIIKDELITETILFLASYRPGGGEYMNEALLHKPVLKGFFSNIIFE